MKIQINIPGSGDIFSVQVEPNDTVLDLKRKIAEMKEIPLHPQYLIKKGKRMEDGRTLASYKIKEDQEIFLLFRARG